MLEGVAASALNHVLTLHIVRGYPFPQQQSFLAAQEPAGRLLRGF